MNTMNDLSKWINEMADEGDRARQPPEDDMLARLALLKKIVDKKNRQYRSDAYLKALIDLQRDQLLVMIAQTLGIAREDFPEFFDHADTNH